ncbi:MAG: hypothetical protein MI919_00655 [Holophagales bacterium]|nr:hypothetical protein [Holophagales bacterium]
MSSSSAPSSPGNGPLRVKGGSIRSKIAFVASTFGPAAEAELVAELAEQGYAQVLEASWYDYDLFDHVLRFIADRWLGGDLGRLRDVGRFSARTALTTTYAFYLGRGDLPGFLGRISKLHERYYSRGSLTVLEQGATRCRLKLHGAGFYREPDLQVAAGFYMGAAELLGCREVRCRIEPGPDEADFLLEWSSSAPPAGSGDRS